jgi:hypothetical protein
VRTGLKFYERKNTSNDSENFLFEDIVVLLFINFRPAVRFIPKNGITLPSGLLINAAACLLTGRFSKPLNQQVLFEFFHY